MFKSKQKWRDEALDKGWLVNYAKVEKGTGKVVDGVLDGIVVIRFEGKVVIFISHTWWDRASQDEDQLAEADRRRRAGKKPDPYDAGAPDYQSGDKKDLKWRVICAGVEALMKEMNLRAEDVMLWCDWQVRVHALGLCRNVCLFGCSDFCCVRGCLACRSPSTRTSTTQRSRA